MLSAGTPCGGTLFQVVPRKFSQSVSPDPLCLRDDVSLAVEGLHPRGVGVISAEARPVMVGAVINIFACVRGQGLW